MNKVNFLSEIESLCRIQQMDYIDAVLHWCQENNIEIELIAEHIKRDNTLKSKIQVEAENLNILKRGARLPL